MHVLQNTEIKRVKPCLNDCKDCLPSHFWKPEQTNSTTSTYWSILNLLTSEHVIAPTLRQQTAQNTRQTCQQPKIQQSHKTD